MFPSYRKTLDAAGREVWLCNGTYWKIRDNPGFSNVKNLELWWRQIAATLGTLNACDKFSFWKTLQTWSFWEQQWIAKGFCTKPNPLSKDNAFTKQQEERYILNIFIYLKVVDTETWWTVWPCLPLWLKYKPKDKRECMRVLEMFSFNNYTHAHFYGPC